jgi:hypothetical protein
MIDSLLNQAGEKTPENQIDPELPATSETGLSFRAKTASGAPVIGRRPGERGRQGRKKTAPGYPDAAFGKEAV